MHAAQEELSESEYFLDDSEHWFDRAFPNPVDALARRCVPAIMSRLPPSLPGKTYGLHKRVFAKPDRLLAHLVAHTAVEFAEVFGFFSIGVLFSAILKATISPEVFLLVRPAGRTYWGVKVSHGPDRGNR